MSTSTVTRKIVLKKTVADCRRELKIAELKFRVSELEITIAEYTSDLTGFTNPNFRPSPWQAALDNSDKALAVLNKAKATLEKTLTQNSYNEYYGKN